MNFYSDNTSNIHPTIMAALVAANEGHALSYGADDATTQLHTRLTEIFECDLRVYLTSTGTAANALALSTVMPSYGATYCHEESHIYTDECGAVELFSGGAQLIPLTGSDSKLTPDAITSHLKAAEVIRPHQSKPSAISISQSTEGGTLYTAGELKKLGELDLPLHMDGARFANALVALECSPAEMTWKVGVELLSFGGTKNGSLASEAVIFFNQNLAHDFDYRQKQAGQLHSKSRFLAAPFLAYLQDDLWLKNARSANAMGAKLSETLLQLPGAKLVHPSQANEVFVHLPPDVAKQLKDKGAKFYPWGPDAYRFVASWSTTLDEITRLLG